MYWWDSVSNDLPFAANCGKSERGGGPTPRSCCPKLRSLSISWFCSRVKEDGSNGLRDRLVWGQQRCRGCTGQLWCWENTLRGVCTNLVLGWLSSASSFSTKKVKVVVKGWSPRLLHKTLNKRDICEHNQCASGVHSTYTFVVSVIPSIPFWKAYLLVADIRNATDVHWSALKCKEICLPLIGLLSIVWNYLTKAWMKWMLL